MENYDEIIRRSIEEFENRKRYAALDSATIARIPDDNLEQAIVDFVIAKVGDNWEHEYEIVTSLPAAIQDVFTTWVLENEVANGGLNQYFWNSSGQFAEEAAVGLRNIGAAQHAGILEDGMQKLLGDLNSWAEYRKVGTLEAFSESYAVADLEDLDNAFDSAGALSPLRIAYIRAHPEQFTAS